MIQVGGDVVVFGEEEVIGLLIQYVYVQYYGVFDVVGVEVCMYVDVG